MTTPLCVQTSKCPIHICSLISAISFCKSARRTSGTFMSKAHARCSVSISFIQVNDPTTGNDEANLVLAGPFERPIVPGSHPLDDVERTATMIARRLDEGHAVSTLSPEGGTHATAPF